MAKPVTLLIGPPGSGKSSMIGRTAPGPVHIIDVDRKIASMHILADRISAGDLTFWELQETIAEEGLERRAQRFADNKKPERAPKGWQAFAQMVDKLGKDPTALAAETWAVDSLTQLAPHLKANILFHSDQGRATFSPREWGYWLSMWTETITVLRDTARTFDKNLILTVHERVSEVPNSSTKLIHEKDSQGQVQRVFLGSMDMRIAASLEGQFGIQIGSYFEEVYQLRVDMEGDKPRWICRVKPDGRRDLRTSFDVKELEFEPDFRKIWKSRS